MIEINKIYNEDNIETMKKIPNKFISGIITSPPYNIATKRKDCYYDNGYSNIDCLNEKEYLDIRLNEFKEFSRILDDCGVICYNISYHKDNPILPTLLMANIHNKTDLTIADIITWKKKSAIPFQTSPTKLSRITELVYIIVKKNHLHNFKTNKEVSKINEKTNQKFYKNYTNLIEARNNDGIICKLKASYSEELVSKLINIYFPENSIIYDPFMGICTTARACEKINRNYIGSELDQEHYQIGISLLNKVIK
ncbi:MAG: site-specific DNA-methyltransferase [Candidatus Muirbacterium halophilum]|nr:site-specific DNA-methyltransferase [Candidatus Muirbacterium halophilum]